MSRLQLLGLLKISWVHPENNLSIFFFADCLDNTLKSEILALQLWDKFNACNCTCHVTVMISYIIICHCYTFAVTISPLPMICQKIKMINYRKLIVLEGDCW